MNQLAAVRDLETEEDFSEGEAHEKQKDRKFAGQAYALDTMRTDLLKARAQVKHLRDLDSEEELWGHLHPICRCGFLVELRRSCVGDTGRTTTTGAEKGPGELCHVS